MAYERNYQRTSAEAVEQITMNKVYGWMSLAMAVTALAAYLTASTPALLNLVYGNSITLWVLIIAELGLVIGLSAGIGRMSFTAAATMMGVYSLLNGVTLSYIFLLFRAETLYTAFITCALTFAGMSALGHYTKRDLSKLGSYLLMGLIGIIVASVVNIFLASNALDAIITYLGLFLFVGLTAYDTQKIKRLLQVANASFADTRKFALLGALTLYLDFINLFLFILRLLGNKR